jgi:hypothetical protein
VYKHPSQGDVQLMIARAIAQLAGASPEQVDLGSSRILVHPAPIAPGYNWSFPGNMVKARFRPFVHRAVGMVRDEHPILEASLTLS